MTITPHNDPAERALLGILIDCPDRAPTCGVRPSDLNPATGHPEVLSAVLYLHDAGVPTDPVLLLEELTRRDQLGRIGDAEHQGAAYLGDLVQAGRNTAALGHYAQAIRQATVRRRLHEVGTRLVQTATGQGDTEVMLDNAADLALTLGMLVDDPITGDGPIPGLSPITSFVDEPSPDHSWVIPGVLEPADRVMLIAGEGIGKSVLSRQICTLLAAGRHPFAPKVRIRPRRTLLIDLENPPDLVRRHLRDLVSQVHAEDLDVTDRAWRWNRPAGMDLRSAADRALLGRVVEKVRPDLIAIGPLYKAWRNQPNDTYETAAAEVAAALDRLRERYGVALWIEHHAPKSDGTGQRRIEPVGSSYWLRWPEFGLALRRKPDAEPNVYHLDRFRGDRDERAWPDELIKGAGPWPWTADYEPETRGMLLDSLTEETT
jgi:hypothetical protein